MTAMDRKERNRIKEIKLVAERLTGEARLLLASGAAVDASAVGSLLADAKRLVECVECLEYDT